MTRLVFLIAAHTDFNQLVKLCCRLIMIGDIYIHIDKKVECSDFINRISRLRIKKTFQHNINFTNTRIIVNWGAYSQVEVQRILLGEALENNIYDRYIFLSGLCYPIKSSQFILNEFETNQRKEYLNAFNLSEKGFGLQIKRISGYHIFRDLNLPVSFFKRIIVSCTRDLLWSIRIRKPKFIKYEDIEKPVYFGGSWIGLTNDCARYVYSELSDDKSVYRQFFKTCYTPDELCIHTIVMNSRFASNATEIDYDLRAEPTLFKKLSPLHELEYNDSIKIYTEKDFDELQHSDKMFVRKVVSGKSDKLIELLDASFDK